MTRNLIRKSSVVLLAAVISTALVCTTAWLARTPDETYQGKPLEFWLRGGQPPPQYLPATNWSPQQAEAAVRHLGHNGIPVLLRKLRCSDSPTTLRWRRLVQKQHLIKTDFIPSYRSNIAGHEGFKILGAAGAPAIPELIRIAENQECFSCRLYAIGSLGWVGPAATNAIPYLVKWLADTNATIRWNTALTLGRIHENPTLVVPALSRLLDDPDSNVRHDAINAIAAFGPAAASAIPRLIRCLDDPTVRSQARDALQKLLTETNANNSATEAPAPR